MTVRGFTASTQRGYIRAVRDFAVFFGRAPDGATAEDLRRYQLHMRSNGASATAMNAAVSALRFFFGVTLGRDDAQVGMTTVREPRKLPVVLGPEEVARLLDAAPGLKYRAALSVAYGAGRYLSPEAASRTRATSSGLSTTGSCARFAHGGHALVRIVPAERHAEEEAQGRDGCVHGGGRGPARSHVQLVAPQVLRGCAIWSAAKKG